MILTGLLMSKLEPAIQIGLQRLMLEPVTLTDLLKPKFGPTIQIGLQRLIL